MPQLTVHNAQISTAAVEIKTLTVSGKQVTLAVFRQLREAELITEDGELNGLPWGTVNYHPDRCSDRPDHWHAVWQDGSELRRARVDADPERRFDRWECDLFDTWYSLCCAAELHGVLPERWLGGKALSPGRQNQVWTGVHCGVPAVALARESVSQAFRWRGAPNCQEKLAAMDEDLHAAVGPASGEPGDAIMAAVERLWPAVQTLGEQEAARRKRVAGAVRAIGDLPQLFIAV